MKKQVSLAGYDPYDVGTLEIGVDEQHPHIYMGDGECTICSCSGFTPDQWNANCITPMPTDADPNAVCGHTRGLHL